MEMFADDKIYNVKCLAAESIGITLLRLLVNENYRPKALELIQKYA